MASLQASDLGARQSAEVLTAELLTARNALLLASMWVLYQAFKAIYNISPLHPLSHLPGPRLAAATYLPEFYYDVVRFGRYTRRIQEMHQKYGPVVRISPHEVHCNDAAFSDEIYAAGGRKRNKPQHQVNGSPLMVSMFGTGEHDLHRLRRMPLAKFFSRSMIARLEKEIHGHAQALCDKLLACADKAPLDITVAYSCFTADTISAYAFGQSFGLLQQPGWYPNFRDPTQATLRPVFFFRFFPFLRGLSEIAKWFVDYLPEDIGLFVRTLQIDLPRQIEQTRRDMDAGIVLGRETIFGSLLSSDLEAHEKNGQRLAAEALAIVGAGTETTSWALSIMTFHLLDKPALLQKLQRELKKSNVVADARHLPSWTELEKIPYLGAVIQEGLRLSYGVAIRTARVATEETLVYRGEWNKKPVECIVPPGYAIGMSAVITHHDESIFPNSDAFIPERWLDDEDQRRREVERGMFAFSKGSRQCIAQNLALCELHIALAALALRVLPRMQLFETTQDDVLYDHDMFIPMPKPSSTGVRITIGS